MKITELKDKLIEFLEVSKDFRSIEDISKFFPDVPVGVIRSVLNNLYQNKFLVSIATDEDSFAIDSKALQKKYKNKILYFNFENPKPVLLVKLPLGTSQETIAKVNGNLQNLKDDYHIITLVASVEEADIQILSIFNATNIQLDELKKIIKGNINTETTK